MTIQIPAGAVNQITELVMRPMPSPSPELAPSAAALMVFELYAQIRDTPLEHFTFLRPISITVAYSNAALAGRNESGLLLAYWDGNRWLDAATTCTPSSVYQRDEAHNLLSVDICHLSTFALVFHHRTFLPTIAK